MEYAPIILFVYNRPEHTRRTLEALAKNIGAKESKLYVFADGPKKYATEADLQKIQDVRDVVLEKKWCGKIHTVFSDINKGLANSVIDGVTEVINKKGCVIVLEDDIVTYVNFLKFMNYTLNMYRTDKNVYGVTGYTFPHNGKIKESTYFLPVMSSWGYGTWKDRWENINFNGETLLKEVESRNLISKMRFGNFDFYTMLQDQITKKNDSWAVRFYTSMILQKGVFLFPNKPFLQNIGLDGSGFHCTKEDVLNVSTDLVRSDVYVEQLKMKVEVQNSILKLFQVKSPKLNNKGFKKIVKRTLQQNLAPELLQFIKRKRKKVPEDAFKQLRKLSRFTECRVKLINKNFSIPDAASFLFMHKEIFVQQIYKFKTTVASPYIIDAGANIGLSVIYFKELYPNAHIVAFEPDTKIFGYLQDNVGQHNYTDVELVPKGLWDKETTLGFNSEGADGGAIITEGSMVENITSIEVVSLKKYLQKPVDFLKIDIEGAEFTVLVDIANSLHMVQNIFIEYHSFLNEYQSIAEILNILTKSGFRLHINSPGLSSLQPFVKLNTYNNMDMQLNIYGFREVS